MEMDDNLPLLEWLANNYKTFGAALEIITDRLVESFNKKKTQIIYTPAFIVLSLLFIFSNKSSNLSKLCPTMGSA